MTLPLLPVRFRGWSRLHSGMLPQAQTMPRRWNKRLPLLLHLPRSSGDQSMRVRMRMMKGTREKLTWSHPKSLLNTWPSRPSHPNPWIRNPQLWLCEMFVPVIMVLLTMDFLWASAAATWPTGQCWSKRFWQGSPRSRARRLVTIAAPDKQVARLYPRKSGLLWWWQLPRGSIQTYCAWKVRHCACMRRSYLTLPMARCGTTTISWKPAASPCGSWSQPWTRQLRHLRSPSKTAVQNAPGMSDIGQPLLLLLLLLLLLMLLLLLVSDVNLLLTEVK